MTGELGVIDWPLAPLVISNRLYVEAQLPYSGKMAALRMRDDLDSKLPRLWDRNYTSNRFEIVNEKQKPVLQVIYKSPREVVVNGVFFLTPSNVLACFGARTDLYRPTISFWDGQATQSMTEAEYKNTFPPWVPKPAVGDAYGVDFEGQRAMFKYPSNRHLGELDPLGVPAPGENIIRNQKVPLGVEKP
jgi:hypothetical protein